MFDSQELVLFQDRVIMRLRAALLTLGKTSDDCTRIARDADDGLSAVSSPSLSYDATTQPVTSSVMQPGHAWKFVYWNYDEKQNVEVIAGPEYVAFTNEQGEVVRISVGQLRDLVSRLPKP